MIEFIKKVYDEAYKESHLSGLQAVWDAAVAHVRSEMTKVDNAMKGVVETVTQTAPESEPQPVIEPTPEQTPEPVIEPDPAPVDSQPEAPATEAPQA